MKQGAYCHDCGERLVGPPKGVAPDDFWPVDAAFWQQALEARRQHCAETGHWAMLFTGLSTDVGEIAPQFRKILVGASAEDALPGHSRTFQDFEAVWTIHPGAQYRMVYLGYVASFDSAANTYDITIPESNTVFRRVPAAFVWKIHPSKRLGEDDD